MTGWHGKRYWLVGASEGLGAALAQQLSATGAEVILSARNAGRLAELSARLPGPSRILPVDVRDSADVARAASEAGEIDGMVFLAGVYWPMKAQNWDTDRAEAMADVNFTGALRVLGRIMPQMVARDSGHIVLTGSLSGFRGLPGAIGYSASKAGLMALGESLQADLAGTGIRVQIANPGFIRTRLTARNDFAMPFLMTPEAAAREMFELMCDEGANVRHFPRLFSLLFRASRFFPHWLYHRLFA